MTGNQSRVASRYSNGNTGRVTPRATANPAVYNDPRFDGSGRPKSPSFQVIGRGTRGLMESVQAKRIGIVKVGTDDLEIPVADLIRNDEDNVVRVGSVVGFLPGGRPRYEIVTVLRARLSTFHKLN